MVRIKYFRDKIVQVRMRLPDGSHSPNPVAEGVVVGRELDESGYLYTIRTRDDQFFLARRDELTLVDESEVDYEPF